MWHETARNAAKELIEQYCHSISKKETSLNRFLADYEKAAEVTPLPLNPAPFEAMYGFDTKAFMVESC